MPYVPRDYQIRAFNMAREEFRKGHKRVLMVAPTGAGKTFISSYITSSHLEKHPDPRVLFLAYGRELIDQASRTYHEYGIDNSVIMAKREKDFIPEMRVQVASIDTILSWVIKRRKVTLPKFTQIIIDEAHRAEANKFQRVIEMYPDAWYIGLTATPIRANGQTLATFETMVNVATYDELIGKGVLVPVRVFAPSVPDLKGIKSSKGDYHQGQLQERLDKVELVGDVVHHWLKHARDRQTVVFASGVAHSIHLRDEFRSHCIKAEHIDGNTPTDERDEIVRKLASGEIQVICNCNCLTEGWDCPPCSCIVLVHPSKQLWQYLQKVGRGLRCHPGKEDCIILDHAGACHRHGWPTQDVPWSIEPGANIQKRNEAKRKKPPKDPNASNEPITCKQCHAVRQGGFACPNCGFKPERQGRGADIKDGELTEVDRENNLAILRNVNADRDTKNRAWDEYVGICLHNNWPIKRACGMYKQKFGVWPRGFRNMPRGRDEYQMPARDWYQVMVSRQETAAS